MHGSLGWARLHIRGTVLLGILHHEVREFEGRMWLMTQVLFYSP